MLILNRTEIEGLLDIDALIDALAVAMADLSAGRASVPDRNGAHVPEHEGILAAMPGHVPSAGALVAKLVSVFPGNPGVGLESHQAVILAFDERTGTPLALLDGTFITAIRTGAGSALSTRLLAREDASTMAILGTGVQARSHARTVPCVRPIREIRIAGRDPAKARALAAELSADGAEADVRACASYAEALAGADIACATTHATEPVVRREWLDAGTHVTSVGLNFGGRELDNATVADALVCVESRRAALAPAPAGTLDLAEPIERGVIGPDHVHAEVGELVAGTGTGRTSDEQITLYKSVGVAAQDAAATALVLDAARAAGVGREVAL